MTERKVSYRSFSDQALEAAARAAHEADRAWCIAHGDTSRLHWEDAPAWQRGFAHVLVTSQISGENGPRESHKGWLARRAKDGWTYGPEFDLVAKRDPGMVDYDDLPEGRRARDLVFVGVVRVMLGLDRDEQIPSIEVEP